MKMKLIAGLILAGTSLFAGPRYAAPCDHGFLEHRRPVVEHREPIRHDFYRHDFRYR